LFYNADIPGTTQSTGWDCWGYNDVVVVVILLFNCELINLVAGKLCLIVVTLVSALSSFVVIVDTVVCIFLEHIPKHKVFWSACDAFLCSLVDIGTMDDGTAKLPSSTAFRTVRLYFSPHLSTVVDACISR
jgi:hypothetical protein